MMKPRAILPVLIDANGERIEFDSLNEMRLYLETNLHAWDVYKAGADKPGFDLRKELNRITGASDYAKWDRSAAASKSASKPRKPIAKAALIASLARYGKKHKGEMQGWNAALCAEFKITSKTLRRKIRDYRIAIPYSL